VSGCPLAIDLFTGLHGWAEGLIAAGWRVIGVDIEDMCATLGEPLPPEHFELVLQDVLTVNGADYAEAQLIVGSSPCTKYSYMAMPWTRSKALAAWYRDPEHPERLTDLNALYDAQFRIQREASEAAGRPIPLVVENVRGAIPWVGRSKWNAGSMHLWGDVPALMPPLKVIKVESFRFDGSGRSFQSASVAKTIHRRDGHPHTKRLTNPAECHTSNLYKMGFNVAAARALGGDFSAPSFVRTAEDKRSHVGARRKAASAKIAKIPFVLSSWIGRCWLPREAAA
jgi:hypothetical protein